MHGAIADQSWAKQQSINPIFPPSVLHVKPVPTANRVYFQADSPLARRPAPPPGFPSSALLPSGVNAFCYGSEEAAGGPLEPLPLEGRMDVCLGSRRNGLVTALIMDCWLSVFRAGVGAELWRADAAGVFLRSEPAAEEHRSGRGEASLPPPAQCVAHPFTDLRRVWCAVLRCRKEASEPRERRPKRCQAATSTPNLL